MTNTQPNPIQTTDAGIPVESDEYSLTVGAGGPILLQDSYLIEQMASFNRERIAERQPHAKGRAHDAHCDIDRIHYAYVPTIALGRWSCLPGRHEARLPASRNFSTAQVRPTASPEREISPKPCDVGSPSQEQRLAQPERKRSRRIIVRSAATRRTEGASVGTNDNKVVGGLDPGYATAPRLVTGASWRSAAACRSADPELFFPLSESGKALEQIAEAKAICTGCPVRRQCLEFALRTRPHGIWGGLTELERHHGRRPMGDDRPRIRTV